MKLSTDTSRLRHLLLMALGQEELGQRIKEAREGADLTQQELADRIGIRQGQTISNYERGVTEVSTKRLRRIAEATSRPITFFVQEPPVAGPVEDVVAGQLAALEERQEHVEELLRELLRRLPDARAEDEAPPG